MTQHTIETVISELVDGVTRDAFVDAAAAVSAFLRQRDDFVAPALARRRRPLDGPRQMAHARGRESGARLDREARPRRDARADDAVTLGLRRLPFKEARTGFAHMSRLRSAIRSKEKLDLTYRSLDEARSRRVVRPLQLEYRGRVWTLTPRCELREGFRSFRTDRIKGCEASGDGFDEEPGKRLEDFPSALASSGGTWSGRARATMAGYPP